jgi:hypothetical protein
MYTCMYVPIHVCTVLFSFPCPHSILYYISFARCILVLRNHSYFYQNICSSSRSVNQISRPEKIVFHSLLRCHCKKVRLLKYPDLKNVDDCFDIHINRMLTLICICTLEVEILDMLRETKQLTLSFGICQYCDYQTSVVLFSPLRHSITIQVCLVEILLK